MSNDMKCQMTWNVKRHEMSNDMKCQKTWNIKWHEMSNDMKCQMTWNVKWHEMSNVKWYIIHDTFYMIHFTWYMIWNVKGHEMSKDMKCQMIHDTWYTPGVTYFGAYHRPPDGHFFVFAIVYVSAQDGMLTAQLWLWSPNLVRSHFTRRQERQTSHKMSKTSLKMSNTSHTTSP